MHQLDRNVYRIVVEHRSAVKPVSTEDDILDAVSFGVILNVLNYLDAYVQPRNLVSRQATMQVGEYYCFSCELFHK